MESSIRESKTSKQGSSCVSHIAFKATETTVTRQNIRKTLRRVVKPRFSIDEDVYEFCYNVLELTDKVLPAPPKGVGFLTSFPQAVAKAYGMHDSETASIFNDLHNDTFYIVSDYTQINPFIYDLSEEDDATYFEYWFACIANEISNGMVLDELISFEEYVPDYYESNIASASDEKEVAKEEEALQNMLDKIKLLKKWIEDDYRPDDFDIGKCIENLSEEGLLVYEAYMNACCYIQMSYHSLIVFAFDANQANDFDDNYPMFAKSYLTIEKEYNGTSKYRNILHTYKGTGHI